MADLYLVISTCHDEGVLGGFAEVLSCTTK